MYHKFKILNEMFNSFYVLYNCPLTIFLYKIGGLYIYLVPDIGYVPTYRFIFHKNVLVEFKYYKSYPEIKEFTCIQPNIVKKISECNLHNTFGRLFRIKI